MRPSIGWGNKTFPANNFIIPSKIFSTYFRDVCGSRRECWWIIYSGKDSMQWMRHRLNAGGKRAFVTLRLRIVAGELLGLRWLLSFFNRLRLTFSSSLSTLHKKRPIRNANRIEREVNTRFPRHTISPPQFLSEEKRSFFITKPKFRTEVEQTLFVLEKPAISALSATNVLWNEICIYLRVTHFFTFRSGV